MSDVWVGYKSAMSRLEVNYEALQVCVFFILFSIVATIRKRQ